jgi:Xylanase inhibitor N-terminal
MIQIAISSIAFMLTLSSVCSNTINFQPFHVHELVYIMHELGTSHSSQFSPNSRHTTHKMVLELVHRDKISNHGKMSYWHLLREQLQHDSERVVRIYRMQKNISNRSFLYKLQDFGSAVVSGAEEGIGEYFVKIGSGSPLVDQYMVIDTGSDLTWVQRQPCTHCYHQADPIFDPVGSASFTRVFFFLMKDP